MLRLLVGVATLMLGGCLWYSSPMKSDGGAGVRSLQEMEAATLRTTPEDVRRQIAGRTWRHAFGGYSYVYYTADDGRVFLWLPDEPRVFAGDWKTDMKPHVRGTAGQQVTAICFRYPGEAVHPVMRQERGDEWYYPPAGSFLHTLRESLAGDAFGLAGRRDAPFVLSRHGKVTLAGLQARLAQR